MRKAAGCFIVIVLLLAIAAACLSLLIGGPRFNGRTLAQWTAAVYPTGSVRDAEAARAFRACSNAPVPYLLRQLDSPGALSLRGKIFQRVANGPLPVRTRAWCRDIVYAETSTPAKAAYMLGVLGPAAEPALPSLLRACTNSNYGVRLSATAALGKIQCQPAKVIPALTVLLQKDDFKVPDNAAWALGQFGPEARSAVPALLKVVQKSSGTLGPEALTALQKIDPTAAATLQKK